MPQFSGPSRSRTDENNSNDASQQESHDSATHENIPGTSRKTKRVNQVNQNSQDTVTLHSSDSDSYLSEDSTCQRIDSEDPLSKYSKVDSVLKWKEIKTIHTRISLYLSKKTLVHL